MKLNEAIKILKQHNFIITEGKVSGIDDKYYDVNYDKENDSANFNNLVDEDDSMFMSAGELIKILSTLNPKAPVVFNDMDQDNDLYVQAVEPVTDTIGKYTSCLIALSHTPKKYED